MLAEGRQVEEIPGLAAGGHQGARLYKINRSDVTGINRSKTDKQSAIEPETATLGLERSAVALVHFCGAFYQASHSLILWSAMLLRTWASHGPKQLFIQFAGRKRITRAA